MGTVEGDRDTATGALGWCGGIRASFSPDEVSEASVQVHGGGGAAEHGENAFQVQKLQLLAVTAEAQKEQQRQLKHKAKGESGIGAEPGEPLGIAPRG